MLPVLFLAAALSGCHLVPSMAAREQRIDPDEEARLNAVAFQEILATHPLSQDAASIQLVQETGQRLAAASGRDDIRWDFKLIQDQQPRAISLSGGRVVVSDSTLGVCQNEAQLAAVIAGAMGRQLAKRSSRQEEEDPSGGVRRDRGEGTPRQSPASIEADSIALSILVGAGYDPEAAQQMWFSSPASAADGSPAETTAKSRAARQGNFQLALDRARFIYRSHPQPLGYGSPIAWSPRSAPQTGPTAVAGEAWTAAIDHGAAKPSNWNADLNAEPAPLAAVASRHDTSTAESVDEEFLPPKTEAGNPIQPAVYEWSSADATLAPRETRTEPQIEFVQPAAYESPHSSTMPAPLPGPMLP